MGEDLRTIKTQQNIQSHFLKLLETYNFKDITIKSLINVKSIVLLFIEIMKINMI